MIRICETKKKMVEMNPRKNSLYVHLDSLLFDLKYDPSVIEIPVPRYFKEDDRIDVDIVFKEKVERDGRKAKKAKKKAKTKKGKKGKKGDDDDLKEEITTLEMKEQWIDAELKKTFKTTDASVEVVNDPFLFDMQLLEAVALIQRNERGRQGCFRNQEMINRRQKEIAVERAKKALHKNKVAAPSKQEQESDAGLII